MQALMQVEDLRSARVLLNPLRVRILERLRERGTCTELARHLSTSVQRVNNHVKELQRAGFVDVVERRRKRNMIESVYQARARSYWLSQRLTRRAADDATVRRDRASLHNLITMSEQLQDDAAALLDVVDESEVPSLGVNAEITLRTEEERRAFARDYLETMHALIERYRGAGEGEHRYTAMFVCYPSADSAVQHPR